MGKKGNKEEEAAKKAREKEKARQAEDKTFGLKNKNKSKAVQQYVKQIQQGASAKSHQQIDREHEEKKKKEASTQQAALLNSLFNMATDKKGRGYDAAAKKKAKEKSMEDEKAGANLPEDIIKSFKQGVYNAIQMMNPKHGVRVSEIGGSPFIAAARKEFPKLEYVQVLAFVRKHKDDFWLDDEDSQNPLVRCQEDVDIENRKDERPLEEIIQEQIQALPPGGTPVTLETFTAWRKKKIEERKAKELEEQTTRLKAPEGPKRTGRELFLSDASLFKDDDNAVDEKYEKRAPSDDDGDGEVKKKLNPIGEETDADGNQVEVNKDVFLNEEVPDLDELSDEEEGENPQTKEASSFNPPSRIEDKSKAKVWGAPPAKSSTEQPASSSHVPPEVINKDVFLNEEVPNLSDLSDDE